MDRWTEIYTCRAVSFQLKLHINIFALCLISIFLRKNFLREGSYRPDPQTSLGSHFWLKVVGIMSRTEGQRRFEICHKKWLLSWCIPERVRGFQDPMVIQIFRDHPLPFISSLSWNSPQRPGTMAAVTREENGSSSLGAGKGWSSEIMQGERWPWWNTKCRLLGGYYTGAIGNISSSIRLVNWKGCCP